MSRFLDLVAQLLSLTGYPTPARVPTQSNPEPKLAPVPPAVCGAGSHALAGEQGRVTAADIASPQAAQGWTCNLGPCRSRRTRIR